MMASSSLRTSSGIDINLAGPFLKPIDKTSTDRARVFTQNPWLQEYIPQKLISLKHF
jgi:hypothetical protein